MSKTKKSLYDHTSLLEGKNMNQNQRDELRHIFLTRNDDELETVCLIAGQILKERLTNLHRYIMDHKDADHKSAEAVIYGLIGENDEMKKNLSSKEKQLLHDAILTYIQVTGDGVVYPKIKIMADIDDDGIKGSLEFYNHYTKRE